MKILITGASGFVGSHIVRTFAQSEDEIILTCRDASSLSHYAKKHKVMVGDLQDMAFINSIVEGVDVLIHVASYSSLYGHKKESIRYFKTPSFILIDSAKIAGVKRFINLSTLSSSPSYKTISQGIKKDFWPHLESVISIENHLRKSASKQFNVINLKCGLFVGEHYSLGLLPILLPRLTSHLTPYVDNAKASMPLVDGRDIAQAFHNAVYVEDLENFEEFDVVSKTIPTAKEVFEYLHVEHNYPLPHFSVPYSIAYLFAYCMEKISFITPFEPFITRSIIHLLQEVQIDAERTKTLLGYQAHYSYKESIDAQINEMKRNDFSAMKMSTKK